MSHFEKTLDSKVIFEGRIVHLTIDTVELENGEQAEREVISHPGGVCVLAVDEHNEAYFVRQFRYPFKKELLELPAGKLEVGEDPAECGKRELLEECGCTADIFLPLAKMYPTCAYDSEVIHIFYASHLHKTDQQLDPGEFLTLLKIPIVQAVQMVLNGEIPDGKTQLGLLTYHAHNDMSII